MGPDRSPIAALRIADGVELPAFGLGLWQVPDGPRAERAVTWALEAGYRHLDTAQLYGNEASVGRALGQSGLARDEVFITTKLDPGRSDPTEALEESVERLGVDRVDLYLVHWPQGGATVAWPGMEQALERGLTRAVGVSNFGVEELDAIVGVAEVVPAVNQIQLSPFHHRRRLLVACERHGVAVEAYSPLTRGSRLADPTIAGVARRHGRTPAQVMLRWGLQKGFAVIPKSVHRERIAENASALEFALSDSDMTELDALDTTRGTGLAVERNWWTWTRRDAARARIRSLLDRVR